MTDLEARLGYTFRNPDLLRDALTHPSYRHEQPDTAADHQRLEFLGDAVLGLLAAEHYYHAFAEDNEGRLTRLRASLASTAPLAAAARSVDLGPHVRLGRGEEASGGRQRDALLADTLEAVLGAAYLDGGLEAARVIFAHVILSLSLTGESGDAADNPKGRLQEWAQQHNDEPPHYRLVHEEGRPHDRFYIVQAVLGDRILGTGAGPNKREAEKHAARNALARIIHERE